MFFLRTPGSRRRMFASDAGTSPINRDVRAVLFCFVHAAAPLLIHAVFLPSA
jgi:hypothetical protein